MRQFMGIWRLDVICILDAIVGTSAVSNVVGEITDQARQYGDRVEEEEEGQENEEEEGEEEKCQLCK